MKQYMRSFVDSNSTNKLKVIRWNDNEPFRRFPIIMTWLNKYAQIHSAAKISLLTILYVIIMYNSQIGKTDQSVNYSKLSK